MWLLDLNFPINTMTEMFGEFSYEVGYPANGDELRRATEASILDAFGNSRSDGM